MSGVISLFLLHAFMAWTGRTSPHVLVHTNNFLALSVAVDTAALLFRNQEVPGSHLNPETAYSH